jgi:hypothetical protein
LFRARRHFETTKKARAGYALFAEFMMCAALRSRQRGGLQAASRVGKRNEVFQRLESSVMHKQSGGRGVRMRAAM